MEIKNPISEVFNEDNMIGMKRYPDKVLLAKQKKAARNKIWREANKDRCNALAKIYREAHRDGWNEQRNNYRKTHPRGIYHVIKQGAKVRNVEFKITIDEFAHWYSVQKRTCIYCERTEHEVVNSNDLIQTASHRLTVDRLNNDAGYSINNIGLCCRRCNIIKGNFFTEQEMKMVGQIIKTKFS